MIRRRRLCTSVRIWDFALYFPHLVFGCIMNNAERYFGSPAKIASCVIEHDLEEEMIRGIDEFLVVTTNYEGRYIVLGRFEGSWEFEEWLCSDLSFEEWKKTRE